MKEKLNKVPLEECTCKKIKRKNLENKSVWTKFLESITINLDDTETDQQKSGEGDSDVTSSGCSDDKVNTPLADPLNQNKIARNILSMI